MNKRFLRDSKLNLRGYLTSLKIASERKNDESEVMTEMPTYAFDIKPECEKQCVEFDSVQREIALQHGTLLPCSVDALMSDGSIVFAIEFKTGRVDIVNVHRKIYDTVLTFIEYDGKDLAYTRERFVYVLVLTRMSKAVKRMGHYLLGMKKPWEKLMLQKDILSLSSLKNYLVHDVIAMPPEFFKRFLHEKKLV